MSVSPLGFSGVCDIESATRLVAEWNSLWNTCPQATVFQAPEWILGSWRHFSPHDPRILVLARAGDALVAVVPLRYYGQTVRFEGLDVSDYCDFLTLPELRTAIVPRLLQFLSKLNVQSCEFERMEQPASILDIALPRGPFARVEEQDTCPFLPLAANCSAFEASVPLRFTKRVRQTQRVASRAFDVKLHRAASAERSHIHLERLFSLHASRWRQRGETGVLSDPQVRRFHHEVAPALLTRGRLWLLELTFDDIPVASTLALPCHKRILYYLGGYAPEYARYSPGRLILAELVRLALNEGFREIDFLRGVERYKYDWGAHNRSTYRAQIDFGATKHCGREAAI